MRTPIFKVICDDEPISMDYPCAITPSQYKPGEDDEVLASIAGLSVGESRTIGGGAAVQFTITRIR